MLDTFFKHQTSRVSRNSQAEEEPAYQAKRGMLMRQDSLTAVEKIQEKISAWEVRIFCVPFAYLLRTGTKEEAPPRLRTATLRTATALV